MNRLELFVDERDPVLSVRLRAVKKRLHGDLTLALIGRLLAPGGCALDVGANRGVYSWAMAGRVGREGLVVAIEPIPANVARLTALSARRPWIAVRGVAASDSPGVATLSIPVKAGRQLDALGTLGQVSVAHEAIDVELVAVDGMLLDLPEAAGRRFGLVKCDVEGHERAVLLGADALLARDEPAVFVEVEQRHLVEGSVHDAFDVLLSKGYRGFFVRGRSLEPLAGFDVERDQLRFLAGGAFAAGDMPTDYVHDFLFVKAPHLRLLDGMLPG